MRHGFVLGKITVKLLSVLVIVSCSAGAGWAEEFLPKPGEEHAWLQQFVGEWESESEAVMEPGQPPVKSKGTETIRSLGGFWTISEVKSTMMDQPFTGNLTLGYDSEKQKYVGTWVDSLTGRLWNYEGTLDASGKALTLEAEGSCPMNPGRTTRFREVIELKSPNHKVFTSSMLGENGEWVTMMTAHSWRKQQ